MQNFVYQLGFITLPVLLIGGIYFGFALRQISQLLPSTSHFYRIIFSVMTGLLVVLSLIGLLDFSIMPLGVMGSDFSGGLLVLIVASGLWHRFVSKKLQLAPTKKRKKRVLWLGATLFLLASSLASGYVLTLFPWQNTSSSSGHYVTYLLAFHLFEILLIGLMMLMIMSNIAKISMAKRLGKLAHVADATTEKELELRNKHDALRQLAPWIGQAMALCLVAMLMGVLLFIAQEYPSLAAFLEAIQAANR
jgi:hypothetical protein